MGDPEAIRFVFDFISPNAYLAWDGIHSLAERHGRKVEPVPVLLAAILNAHDRKGPAEVREMARWMFHNCLRKAALLGIPLEPPTSHPFNPLLALRIASLPMPEPDRRRVIDALFAGVWAGGPGVTDPAEVAEIVGAAGFDGERTVAEAGTKESKDRLRRQTDAALAEHVFGVPSMLVGAELFWGYDDFDFLERYLRGDDPLPRERMLSWAEVRASAHRKRP